MQVKLAIVGEAWGEQEERERTPFVGPSGYLLTQMLREAGIERTECYLTNVFNLRPPGNDLSHLCVNKRESTTGLPPLATGKYLDAQYLPELVRLFGELQDVRPNLVLALGNTAAWALLRNAGISKIRGTVTQTAFDIDGRRVKVLPAYHPAAILRQWDLRHVTVLDFQKAKLEAEFPEIRRPARQVFIEPTLEDLQWFEDEHLKDAKQMSVDIETHGRQITCIGFAPTPQVAISVPFTDERKPGCNYWPTQAEELAAWAFVRRWLASPIRKIFQNGLYDLQFIWKYGMAVANCEDDSMLLHHSLQPESPKGLAFLGSVYTNESSWKLMRARGKKTIKADE